MSESSPEQLTASSPLVTIVIPCRNEADWIRKCLESVAANDFPKEQLEVLVLDGQSDDGTAPIVAEFAAEHPWVKLLENPRKTAPAALNIGIEAARGQVIMRMDAHNEYPPDYISKLVGWLEKSGADNVGGVWTTVPSNDTATAKAIALGCSHPFGVGNAKYRVGVSEPCEADTVPFGCYRRDVFDRIGLFDEELVRNQDNEFNQRLKNAGGKILLVPDVVSYYHARDTLAKLWCMYYQYGYFNALVVRKIGGINVRHWIPSLFVLGLVVSGILAPFANCFMWLFCIAAAAYLAPLATIAAVAAVQHGFRVGALLAAVFVTIHFGKGIGFLKGAFDFWVLRKQIAASDATNVRITR